MNRFVEQYKKLAALFNARAIRERVLIAGLIMAVIINGWLMLVYDPLAAKNERLQSQLLALQKQIESVDKQYAVLNTAKRVDPDRELKQRIRVAKQHIAKLDAELAQKMKGLIKPTQMAAILEQVLTENTSMRFERIQSLQVEPLLVSTNDNKEKTVTAPANNATNVAVKSASNTEIGVYRHGIEMEFSGSYLETLDYLKQLQQLPWNFYWDDVLFDVLAYPRSRIIIRVHTLSLKEGWIGV